MNLIDFAKFKKMVGGGSGGGSATTSVRAKDLNFYDYDGTRVYAYTLAEAQALTELPKLPEHTGLTAQEWNYTLEEIKSYNRPVDVGATYITDDGKTRIYISLKDDGRLNVPLYIYQSKSNAVVIDWGDGSAEEESQSTGSILVRHTYPTTGDYVITLDCGAATVNAATVKFWSSPSSNEAGYKYYRTTIRKVDIGNGFSSLGDEAFNGCSCLESIVIPSNVTSGGTRAFADCAMLSSIVIPHAMYTINDYMLNGCRALTKAILPHGLTKVGQYAFSNCVAVDDILLPDAVTSIGSQAFRFCYSFGKVIIPKGVTSLASYVFSNVDGVKIYDFSASIQVVSLSSSSYIAVPSDCEIRVPSALYDEWIAASNWSSFASQIVAV